jgi:hypothetical protein
VIREDAAAPDDFQVLNCLPTDWITLPKQPSRNSPPPNEP